MAMEHGVESLPGEHPYYTNMRFVCDNCKEPMLSAEGLALDLPVMYGGEPPEEGMSELLPDPFDPSGLRMREAPAPELYHVHVYGCLHEFIVEHEWPFEHVRFYRIARPC
jgi:hypothetical protein